MKMVGVDVGGTFTDAVYYDDRRGEICWSKSPSTVSSPAEGVVTAIEQTTSQIDDLERFVHGITIGTNTILEGHGAKVWMVTTQGFGDVLEIARTNRTRLYDIKTLKALPIVPRHQVFEVNERLSSDGSVIRALDITKIEEIGATLQQQPSSAVIVCFLHSYINPAHETEAAERLRELLPEWYICSSAEILPEKREYERFSTTALNAYIGPITKQYLGDLDEKFHKKGYKDTIYLMAANGGIVTAEHAARFPIQTVLSGPAAGVAAAKHLGSLIGVRNLITYDMGGTSTDVCLIRDLSLPMTSEQFIEEKPIRIPQIEIATVGAGGGSIAWVDYGKILMIGPQSAGATPGPACYDQGGSEPTVTDANLILGRLSSNLKLGGSITLREEHSLAAIKKITGEFPELNSKSAAEGIINIACAKMVTAIKQISVTQGYDPRDFALLAYGGAGPMHAVCIAEAMEISHVIIPPGPGNFSAFGALISTIRHDYVKSYVFDTQVTNYKDIRDVFEKMKSVARDELVAEGIANDNVVFGCSCGMRYLGQSWDLTVPVMDEFSSIDDLLDGFFNLHKQRFGYLTESAVEIVSFRLSAEGMMKIPNLLSWKVVGELEGAITDSRLVYFSGTNVKTNVYARDLLPASANFMSPAIIEEMGSVTVVPPGWQILLGKFGEIHLNRREERK